MAANLTTTYAYQILDLLGLSKFKGGNVPPPPPPPIKISLPAFFGSDEGWLQVGCGFSFGAYAMGPDLCLDTILRLDLDSTPGFATLVVYSAPRYKVWARSSAKSYTLTR